jgi:hypothetical protein
MEGSILWHACVLFVLFVLCSMFTNVQYSISNINQHRPSTIDYQPSLFFG